MFRFTQKRNTMSHIFLPFRTITSFKSKWNVRIIQSIEEFNYDNLFLCIIHYSPNLVLKDFSLFIGGSRAVCNLPKVTGPCRAAFRRWYFNKATGRCEMFTYGGCRGNANNFRTKTECEQKCLKCKSFSTEQIQNFNPFLLILIGGCIIDKSLLWL